MGGAVTCELVDVARHEQADGTRLHVTLDAGDLASEEEPLVALRLEGVVEMPRAVDEGIAVHRAEAGELRPLQAGDHAEDALLLRDLHLRLEADEVEVFIRQVFLAELNDVA